MRFFAEAAWYPTALLPSQGVRWQAVDDHSAKATLADGTLSVTMLFNFNDAGMIESVRAEARAANRGQDDRHDPLGSTRVELPGAQRYARTAHRRGVMAVTAGAQALLAWDHCLAGV